MCDFIFTTVPKNVFFFDCISWISFIQTKYGTGRYWGQTEIEIFIDLDIDFFISSNFRKIVNYFHNFVVDQIQKVNKMSPEAIVLILEFTFIIYFQFFISILMIR